MSYLIFQRLGKKTGDRGWQFNAHQQFSITRLLVPVQQLNSLAAISQMLTRLQMNIGNPLWPCKQAYLIQETVSAACVG